jgi:hypothetical protein
MRERLGESIIFDADGSVSMVHTTAGVNFIDRVATQPNGLLGLSQSHAIFNA